MMTFLTLQAKELEIETHCRIDVKILPPCGTSIKAKTWQYQSGTLFGDQGNEGGSRPTIQVDAGDEGGSTIQVDAGYVAVEHAYEIPNPEVEIELGSENNIIIPDITFTEDINNNTVTPSCSETKEAVTPSPCKRHRSTNDIAAESEEGNANNCKVCGSSDSVSFWLGCGHKNRVTKRSDCPYWVHQACIGLHFTEQAKLNKVPFFCRDHIPKSTTKGKKRAISK